MRRNRLLAQLTMMLLPRLHAGAQGYSPAEAPPHMTLAPDLQVALVASEPTVAQPVSIEFDERGRLWVMQYLQYPNPVLSQP